MQTLWVALPAPPPLPQPDIFFFEELAVASALHHVASLSRPPKRVLVFCDNLDTVYAFSTLRVSQSIHNAPLLAAAAIMSTSGIDVRVRHIAGEANVRADMLSRLLLDEYHSSFPADRVRTFEPPRALMPTRWQAAF